MFGLDFLFGSALLALPLAAAPVLLHLLFRRKSPVVQFSTLRFVKLSIQHTAARKRVQRWLLLACRVLLLALLIWAVAQPVRKLASGWGGGGQGVIAAVVVDTSYSMELREGQASLLDKADGVVQDLLRGPLANAQVAVFRSQPGAGDRIERLETAAKIQSQWVALKPTPAPVPLSARAAAAAQFLGRQPGTQKWLVIVSDLQRREFAAPLPPFPGGRVVLFDLHPDEARAAAVTRVGVLPEQPLPGIGSEAFVEVTGRAGDSRFAGLSVTKTDGTPVAQKPPLRAAFEGNGPARLTFPIQLPAERWMLLAGALQQDEPLPWAKTRAHLVETPPRQAVTFVEGPPRPGATASKFMRLALDPSEGRIDTWPLDVKPGPAPTGRENAVVAPLLIPGDDAARAWPAEAVAARLANFARSGGTVVLALQPGMEAAWPALPPGQKDALAELLPSPPYASAASSVPWKGGVADEKDPLLAGLVGGKSQFEPISVRRFVPLAVADPNSTAAVLNMTRAAPAPAAAGSGTQTLGLLFRKKVGAGLVYTLATLPESRYTNLATHTRFLPVMVRMCLRPASQAEARNVELGDALVLAGPQYAGYDALEIQGPKKELYVVKPKADPRGGRRFEFAAAAEPGLYTWRKPGEAAAVALTQVQWPAAEAELVYQEAKAVATEKENTIIARSFGEFEGTMARITEPEPQWKWPIAVVLFLLCVEALMGSASRLRKPGGWRGAAAQIKLGVAP